MKEVMKQSLELEQMSHYNPSQGGFHTVATDTNFIAIAGRTVADPVIRTTPTGKEVAQLRVATNHWNGKEEVPSFHNVVAWEKLANTAKMVRKGQRVVVTGRMTYRSYENQAGVKVTTSEIVASTLDAAAEDKDPGISAPATDDLSDMPF